jgi:type IV secretion system protein TrbL
MRHGNSLRRTVSIALIAVALLALLQPSAQASPSTEERRAVAEEVAASTCSRTPEIPGLPPSVNPAALCRTVIVENIDPDGTNAGVAAACLAALPLPAKYAAKVCAKAVDKVLDPARQLFLDKVVPVAQQLACVTSTPAAFDCLAQQVHVWLKQSITSLWAGLITAATADTAAVAILDGWRNPGLVSLYSDIGSLGVTLLLGIVLTSLIVSAIRFDFRQSGSVLVGIAVWGLFWSGGAVIAVMLVKASDAAARWMAGRPDATGQTDLTRAGAEFGRWVDYITATTTATAVARPTYSPGSFTALLICLLLIIAIVVTVVALLMRNVALLLLIVLLPLTLAGTAGPRLTRSWFHAALRLFIAFLLAKPLIVIALRLGAVLVSVPKAGEPQATFVDALLGVTIILVAGLLPGVIYRFSGGLMSTSAGAAPRASGGVSAQSAQSFQSHMDMVRMVMERNAPEPMYAKPAGTALRGMPTTTAAPAARGLSAAAGPLSLVATAGAMAGGAMESGGRWAAGQAATGGGVVGDVEAPHVPTPPISRAAHLGRGSQRPDGSQLAAPATGQTPSAGGTVITITQTHGPGSTRPTLPPQAPPLVIPGTVVPAPDPPASPKALPPGGEGS